MDQMSQNKYNQNRIRATGGLRGDEFSVRRTESAKPNAMSNILVHYTLGKSTVWGTWKDRGNQTEAVSGARLQRKHMHDDWRSGFSVERASEGWPNQDRCVSRRIGSFPENSSDKGRWRGFLIEK
jgi:hypothetical protein